MQQHLGPLVLQQELASDNQTKAINLAGLAKGSYAISVYKDKELQWADRFEVVD